RRRRLTSETFSTSSGDSRRLPSSRVHGASHSVVLVLNRSGSPTGPVRTKGICGSSLVKEVLDMVVYNEIVAVTAGAGLMGVAAFLNSIINGRRINSEAWAAFFGVTGLLLFVLGIHTTVTWPFGGAPFEYANIAFGQPAAAFGA